MFRRRRFFPFGIGIGVAVVVATTLGAAAFAQSAPSPPSVSPPAPATAAAPPPVPEDHMLDYENALLKRADGFQDFLDKQASDHRAFLDAQTTEHRDFLERIYTAIAWVAGLAVTVFTAYGVIVLKGVKRWVTERFNDEVRAAIKKQTDKLKDETDAQITLTRQSSQDRFNTGVDYASVIAWAAVVLNFDETTDPRRIAANNRQRGAVIERMEAVQDKVPRSRTFNIFLGRLYRAADRLEAAIHLLTEVMKRYDPANPDHHSDCAAFLYNRACYRTLLARQYTREGRPISEVKPLYDRAWQDLRTVVNISPKDRVEAIVDPDFDGLLGSDPTRDTWDRLDDSPGPKTTSPDRS